MNGKHAKVQKQKQKKKSKLRIKDKKQFLKMVIAMSALILSFVFLMIHGNKVKQSEMVDQDIEVEQTEQVKNQENISENIDKNQEIKDNNSNSDLKETKVTSRGGIRDMRTTAIPEKLKNPETKYISTESGLNVRESYSMESKIVKSLAYATKVTITEKYQDWGKIGDAQWVNMKYLSNKKPIVKVQAINKKPTTPSTIPSSGYIAFTATGYCPCSKCCGKSTGITASGARAKAGVTVAMSSKYAFGTKIEVKGMGTYICQDRGGAIQGNRIDIYFSSHQEALNFGRRTVYVKILK